MSSELGDLANARDRHQHHHMPAVICIALTVMVGIGAFFLFTKVIPDANTTLANLLFGALLAKWGDSIAYWVGTTRSSEIVKCQKVILKLGKEQAQL